MSLSKRETGGRLAPPPAADYLAAASAGLLVLDFGELGVDDVAFGLLSGLLPGTAGGLLLRSLRFGVHLLAELLRGLCERLRLGVDLRLVVRLDGFLGFLRRRLDLIFLARVQLVAVVLERFPHRVH